MRRRKPDSRNPNAPRPSHGQEGPRSGKAGGRPAARTGGRAPGKGGGKGPGKGPRKPAAETGFRAAQRADFRPDRNPERGPERHPERGPDRKPGGKTDHRPGRPGRPEHRSEHRQEHQARRPERSDHPEHRPARFHPGRGDLPVWLYGLHACRAALDNPERRLRRLLATREALAELGADLPAQPQPETVDRARLESLLPPGAVHQGIALLADPLEDPGVESLSEAVEDAEGRDVVLVLDHVTDPRNVGAILRSAAAFGARAMIVTDRHAPEATGALAKAASGGLEVVPLIRVTNLARALDLLAAYGYWRVGLEMETEKTLAEAVGDLRRVALVLGAEDEGLRRLTREKCDFLAKLPMSGAVESLNVSAAAAVALYECARG